MEHLLENRNLKYSNDANGDTETKSSKKHIDLKFFI